MNAFVGLRGKNKIDLYFKNDEMILIYFRSIN